MRAIKVLESWIRRHMRKYFWQRWHNRRGRMNALRQTESETRILKQAAAQSARGEWPEVLCCTVLK